ncbi:MAG TPA: glycosyltransferase family 4 protein [Fimbriimonadaceae bacterium]|nr:glycosyltransferase family 4 protein [Fimbriimonadaceae bacterium]
MKVLFLSMHYRPEPCDTRTSQLAKAFAAKGHSATALTSFPNYPFGKIYPGYRQKLWDKRQVDGVSLVRVPMVPDHSKSSKKRALSYLSFGASAAFIGALVTRRPDLIWIHHPPLGTGLAGWFLATLKRVPFVYEIHDLWPETLTSTGMVREGRLTHAIRKVCNFLHRRANAVVVTSHGMKLHLERQGLDPEKIHVFPQWADEETFKPVTRDEAFGIEHGLAGKFNVVFAGNIGVAQQLQTALDAASHLRDVPGLQLVFIGAGVELESLKRRAKEHNLANVLFLGQQPPTAMPDFYAWADGLLVHLKDDPLFSITIPSKVQTYMSCGVPILCGVSGDAAELVANANAGICFPPENARAMEHAVRELVSMKAEQREELGRNAAAGYEQFCSQAMLVDRYESLFENVVESRKAALLLGRLRHASNRRQ